MILSAFTLFHVLIGLVGIASGFVIVYGLLTSRRMDGWTAIFLSTTIATSVTGFMFPVQHFMPSHGVAIISLIVLAFSVLARYRHRLEGGWRRTYAITAVIALYLNFFVLIVQLFEKVPALKELAPTQTEPAFVIAQSAALLLFTFLGIRSAMKFHGEPLHSA